MLDPFTLRFLERIIIELGGMLSIFLGAILFRSGNLPSANVDVERAQLWKLKIANTGPGVFFALFGAAILTYGMLNPIKLVEETIEATDTRQGSAARGEGGAVGTPQPEGAASPTAGSEGRPLKRKKMEYGQDDDHEDGGVEELLERIERVATEAQDQDEEGVRKALDDLAHEATELRKALETQE